TRLSADLNLAATTPVAHPGASGTRAREEGRDVTQEARKYLARRRKEAEQEPGEGDAVSSKARGIGWPSRALLQSPCRRLCHFQLAYWSPKNRAISSRTVSGLA